MASNRRTVFDALARLIDYAKDISTANVVRTCEVIDGIARWQYINGWLNLPDISDHLIDAMCLLSSKATHLDHEKHHRICSTFEALTRFQDPLHGSEVSDHGQSSEDRPLKPIVVCRNCLEEGHEASDCPDERVLVCRMCARTGHVARDCEEPVNMADAECRNCCDGK